MKTIFRSIFAAVVSLAVLASAAVDLRAEAAGACEVTHSDENKWGNDYALSSGEFFFDEAVKLTKEIEITGDVTICLNGKTITAAENSRIFDIKGGSLTICDCAGGGVITGGNVKEHSGNGGSSGGAIYVDNSSSTVTLNGGTINGNSAVQGGGVYVNGNASFEMSKGSISNNTAGHQGGGVYVNGGAGEGGFTMSGGEISGNKVDKSTPDQQPTTYSGGGVYTAGKFTMSGNSVISNNTAGTEGDYCFGGGVNISGTHALFTMNGGTLSGNKALWGGAVYLSDEGDFVMDPGAIVDANFADKGGGGVGLGGGSFTMNGGTISNNTTSSNGGGVFLNAGEFIMSGGTISNNSSRDGGGVHLIDIGQFTMSGGAISDNSASRNGCGVYVGYDENSSGKITLDGTVTITSKPKTNGLKNNVYLRENRTITIGNGFDITSPIGIHPEVTPDCKNHVPVTTFADSVAHEDISAKFSADVNGQTVLYNETDAQVKLKGDHVYDMETWGRDPENHWNTCTKCYYQMPHESHNFDGGVITKQPTYTQNGVITYTCEDCRWQKTEPIPRKTSDNDDYNYNRNDNENSSKNAAPYNPPTGIAVSLAPTILAAFGIAAAIRRRR